MVDAIRTFTVNVEGRRVPVNLGFSYTGWALALAEPTNKHRPLFRVLSALTADASFPSPSPISGGQVFCMITRASNQGLLAQLVAQHVLWEIPIPKMQHDSLVEVLLGDAETAHTCLKCARDFASSAPKPFELPGEPRLPQCSKCRVTRYCDAKCQEVDAEVHKLDCKLWRTRPHEAAQLMEKRRREDIKCLMQSHGFTTLEQLARYLEKR
ncbi:hypothetical protein EV714DRAFT_219506 [Schizophyllum commune]